jgi:hypothetical protein
MESSLVAQLESLDVGDEYSILFCSDLDDIRMGDDISCLGCF